MFELPVYVEEILDRLASKGYEAYIVGGAVRDMVMGELPNDYDITTNCRPDDIEELFSDKTTIGVGKKFGTINIVNHGENVEVTSYRTDGDYTDGRRPEEVKFSDELSEDLKRRDFTINALAYNHREGIIDLFNGLKDIEDRVIRTVGKADRRFNEDYLRILRGIRFSVELSFRIEDKTFRAMKEKSKEISKISPDRIREEFFKMILSDRPSDSIRLLDDIDMLEILFPEIYRMKGFDQKSPFHSMDLYEHTLCVLDKTDPILEQRLGALFHDIGKLKTFSIDKDGIGHFYGHSQEGVDISRKILRRLNSSNKLINNVGNIIHYHMNNKDDMKTSGLKRLLRRFGEENIFNLFKVQKADTICSNNIGNNILKIDEREKKIIEIINEKEPYDRRHLKINGRDLIEIGYEEGKELGEILDYLFELVLEDKELNKREILLEKAREEFKL